ncbi:MAG: preprotein translocase subunit SecG, partial [Phycisphaerales bacterium]
MIVILLQRGRGGGLAGAFGGAGGTSAFGAKTGDVFTWITVVVATTFVLLAVISNFVFDWSARRPQATAAETTPATSETSGDEAALPIEVRPLEVPPPTPTGEAESDTGTEGTAPAPDSPTTAPSDKAPGGEDASTDDETGAKGPAGDTGAGSGTAKPQGPDQTTEQKSPPSDTDEEQPSP